MEKFRKVVRKLSKNIKWQDRPYVSQLGEKFVGKNPTEGRAKYDLSEEADGAYWLRGEVSPSFIKGAYLLIGLNSDDELLYGVGYNCSDNVKIITEFSSGVKDADGNDVENDFSIRASYSF